MDEPQRIVCIHMNQLGDLLFSLPALYNIRSRYPDAYIASLVRPSCKGILGLSGLVDDIIERPKGPFVTDLKTAARLRSDRFDLLLLFSTSFGAWMVSAFSGARSKVGFVRPMHGLCLHKRVSWSPPPSTQNNLRLAEAIGCPLKKRDYVGLIHPGFPERDQADRLLAATRITSGRRFAVLAPGSSTGREVKCWSDEGFAQVADALMSRFGLQSIVVGLGGGEKICRLSEHAIDMTGKTSLPVLAALLSQSVVFIGIDSGVMHLASAMDMPLVGIFGPTDPRITGPQGKRSVIVKSDARCAPCFSSTCDRNMKCMTEITVAQVITGVESVLGERV